MSRRIAYGCLLVLASGAWSVAHGEPWLREEATVGMTDFTSAVAGWESLPGFHRRGTAPGHDRCIVKLYPLTLQQYFARADFEENTGNYERAIADYDKGIALDPENASAYNNRGSAKNSKGDLKGAIADYDQAIALDSNCTDAYVNRAMAKETIGDREGAVADCNRSLEIDPKFVNGYVVRASMEEEDKEGLKAAMDDCNRAIELDPKCTDAYIDRGCAKQIEHDLDGAIADYTRAIEIDPKEADAYNSRGIAKIVKGDCKDALEDLGHGRDLSPNGDDYPSLFTWIARARLGEMKEANAELSAHMKERPKSKSGDWVSKIAGHLMGGINEKDFLAAAESPDAKKANEQHCEGWFYAGMKELLDGNKATAVKYFHNCIATDVETFIEFQMAGAALKEMGEEP